MKYDVISNYFYLFDNYDERFERIKALDLHDYNLSKKERERRKELERLSLQSHFDKDKDLITINEGSTCITRTDCDLETRLLGIMDYKRMADKKTLCASISMINYLLSILDMDSLELEKIQEELILDRKEFLKLLLTDSKYPNNHIDSISLEVGGMKDLLIKYLEKERFLSNDSDGFILIKYSENSEKEYNDLLSLIDSIRKDLELDGHTLEIKEYNFKKYEIKNEEPFLKKMFCENMKYVDFNNGEKIVPLVNVKML